MFIYLFNIIFIGILYFVVYHSTIPRIHFLRLSLLYLFIIASFRDQSIGKDYHNYIQAFRWIHYWGGTIFERGYILLNKAVTLFTHHYAGLAVAVNMFLFVPLYRYLRDRVDAKYWGLCVFIFTANPYMFIQTTFNVLRQACATGIILLGMRILFDKNRNKTWVIFFYFTILIAAQFHRISYVFGLIPLMLTIRWKKAYWLAVTTIALAINRLDTTGVFTFISDRLHFAKRYVHTESSVLNHPIYILFVVCFIFFLLSHYEAFSSQSIEKKRLIDFYLLSLCYLIMALSNDSAYRVYMIMAFCALPAIPIICESTYSGESRFGYRQNVMLVKGLYIFYYLSFYIGYLLFLAAKSDRSYIPFRFFFS